MPDKQKLTLSVDSDIVEKAKDLKLNISEITEQVLTGLTFEPEKEDHEEMINKYKEVFQVMVVLLRKFHASMRIGYVPDDTAEPGWLAEAPVTLSYKGDFSVWFSTEEFSSELFTLDKFTSDVVDNAKVSFDTTSELLNNLIKSISNAAERQKRELKELEALKGIVKVISTSLLSDNIVLGKESGKKGV